MFPGRVLWTREEALANVVVAEFVDLPVSDMEAALESEFDQKEGYYFFIFTLHLFPFFVSFSRHCALNKVENHSYFRVRFESTTVAITVRRCVVAPRWPQS